MLQRFWSVLPVAIFALCLAAISGWYVRRRPYAYKSLDERLVNWCKELMRFAPRAVIIAPCLEEVAFRMPIVVAFGRFSPVAWLMIVQTSILFGFMHLYATHEYMFQGRVASTRIHRARRSFHVGATSALGFLLALLAVRFQSLLLPLVVHTVWNGVVVIALGIFARRKLRQLEQMGLEVSEVLSGRALVVHVKDSLEHGISQSISFEQGAWAVGLRAGEKIRIQMEGKPISHKVYLVRDTGKTAHVFAVPD